MPERLWVLESGDPLSALEGLGLSSQASVFSSLRWAEMMRTS